MKPSRAKGLKRGRECCNCRVLEKHMNLSRFGAWQDLLGGTEDWGWVQGDMRCQSGVGQQRTGELYLLCTVIDSGGREA